MTQSIQPTFKGDDWLLYNTDCITGSKAVIPAGTVNLCFCDSPYNYSQDYTDYDDSKTTAQFLAWCHEWMAAVYQSLAPDGSFWFAMSDHYVAECIVAAKSFGFKFRSIVTWYYTFGQNNNNNFSRSHTHLVYFVKDKKKFTFNADDPAVRVPSARQLVYNDKRGNPKGRLPDDTWILRPQAIPEAFLPLEDTWHFSRVCGTFKDRKNFSPNQMRVEMLDRIVRSCSNVGDLVVDFFNGTGVTGEACLLSGRKYIGFDVSKKCIDETAKRLEAVVAKKGKL